MSVLVRDYPDAAVVIAGGTSGVGLASALAFTDAGTRRLALLGRNPQRGDAARDRILDHCPEAEVVFVRTDAEQVTDVEHAVESVLAAFGAVDVLVSSVTADYVPDLLFRLPIGELETVLTRQALPPMLLTRAFLPLMQQQEGGSIVLIASDAAKTATPGESVLGGAMAAIVMFARVVALEAKRNGVRVNAVTPSLIANTPTGERALRDGFSRRLFEKATAQAHLGVAEPEDLASLIVFLGGPGAARLTGQAISVNGGISAS
jgi:2-hydroxycyclohexanecarboxyl-CoA dehydrogenase